MTKGDHGEQPDATVAFDAGPAGDRDESPGMAEPDRAAADVEGGVLPPLAPTAIDPTPVRERFANGGE